MLGVDFNAGSKIQKSIWLWSGQCKYSLTNIPVYVYNIPMYSVKEAAQKLGLDTSQVRRLLAKGEIKGKKLARDWVVLELNYKKKKFGVGRKKTKKE
jgi:excisionase family DNA binding protein